MCRIVENSDDNYPPRLHHRHQPKHHSIAGEWFSSRCEVRPIGNFITRHLIFTELPNGTWEGFYHHFGDEHCREPMFSIYARGSYVIGQPSLLVDSAFNVDIKVSVVHVTPRDERILNVVKEGAKRGTCGKMGTKWQLGVEKDVTHTGGCAELTLAVPMIELELAKLEFDHKKKLLLLGQRPVITEDYRPLQMTRPTSFQPPLIKCTDRTELSLSLRVDNVGYTVVQRTSGSDVITASQVTCLAAILLNIFMLHFVGVQRW